MWGDLATWATCCSHSLLLPTTSTLSAGVRSLQFNRRLLSTGTGAGHLYFYDLCAQKYLDHDFNCSCGRSFTKADAHSLTASPGWLVRHSVKLIPRPENEARWIMVGNELLGIESRSPTYMYIPWVQFLVTTALVSLSPHPLTKKTVWWNKSNFLD